MNNRPHIALLVPLIAFVLNSFLPLEAASLGRRTFESEALAPVDGFSKTPISRRAEIREAKLALAAAATNGGDPFRPGSSAWMELLEARVTPPHAIVSRFRHLVETKGRTSLEAMSQVSANDFGHITRGAAAGLLHPDFLVREAARDLLVFLANSTITLSGHSREVPRNPTMAVLWKILAWSVLPWEGDGNKPRALLRAFYGDTVNPVSKETRQTEGITFIYTLVKNAPERQLSALFTAINSLKTRLHGIEPKSLLRAVKRGAIKASIGNGAALHREFPATTTADINGNLLQPDNVLRTVTSADNWDQEPPRKRRKILEPPLASHNLYEDWKYRMLLDDERSQYLLGSREEHAIRLEPNRDHPHEQHLQFLHSENLTHKPRRKKLAGAA